MGIHHKQFQLLPIDLSNVSFSDFSLETNNTNYEINFFKLYFLKYWSFIYRFRKLLTVSNRKVEILTELEI